MTQDDRMETITDPALIRATDEPDERGDFPCCTTPAPVGVAVELDLDAARAMLNAANTIKATGGAVEIGGVRIEPCDEYGSTVTTARAEAAEAEVVTLRAKVARSRSRHCGCGWCCSNNADSVIPGDAHLSCSRYAALAVTTGEGQ